MNTYVFLSKKSRINNNKSTLNKTVCAFIDFFWYG